MPDLIIVGLGNPGAEYQTTRHNAGFMVCDSLVEDLGWSWQFKSKWQADLAQYQTVLIVKPQTYMNRSGDSVASIINFFNWSKDQIATGLVVIHDDLDIMLGQYQKSLARGPKQHNGLISLEQSLQTDQFTRYRLGIDNRQGDRTTPGDEYVLSSFTPDEKQKLNGSIQSVVSELNLQIQHAQNR